MSSYDICFCGNKGCPHMPAFEMLEAPQESKGRQMTNRCKDCARLELGLKWWFCTKDGHHIKEFDGKTYIPDPNWKGCEENFVRRDKVQYLPELYDALKEATENYCGICHNLSGHDEPKIEDLIKNGCPKKRNLCKAIKWLDLLRKVRDGV